MAVTTGATVLAFVVPFSLVVRSIEQRLEVDGVVDLATSLASFIDDEATIPEIEAGVARFETAHPDMEVEVYGRDGTVVGTDEGADDAVAEALRGQRVIRRDDTGLTVDVPNNGPFGASSDFVVRVHATGSVLDLGVRRFVLVLLGSALVAIAIGGGVGLIAARRISTPTRRLTATARRLKDGDFDARVAPAGPEELRALATTLNLLAARIDELLVRERESAADVAHRLRTPLTALNLELESMDDSPRAAALRDRADRLGEALDEVIVDMREPTPLGVDRTDLCRLVRDRLADWEQVAAATSRPLSVSQPSSGPCWVAVGVDDAKAAFDAIMGNAMTHTPPGTAVAVTLDRTEGAVRVLVDDAGSGFTDQAVVDRGHSEGGSTGLGLDIANRTATRGGGRLELGRSPLGGARVALILREDTT